MSSRAKKRRIVNPPKPGAATPSSRWRRKLMVRTSVTVPFEPTGAAKPQGDRPKSARSTNPQYQCGFRANREETKHRSRDALHRPPSSAYSIENTGITGKRNPFRQAPRVTPSFCFAQRPRPPERSRLIPHSLAPSGSCPFRRAFLLRRNRAFLLCTNRTFLPRTDRCDVACGATASRGVG